MLLVKPENTWVLFAILTSIAAFSIYLEQTYSWASKLSGCILALGFTMIFSNFGIIPIDAPAYDIVWDYVVPLAIPMLLFQADIKKIWKESGRVLFIYLIGGAGTIIGGFVAFFLMRSFSNELYKLTAMMVGTYTGGSVNLVTMQNVFPLTNKELAGSAIVADNLIAAFYFISLSIIPTMKFFKKNFLHPYQDELEKGSNGEVNRAAEFWVKKEISLLDVAKVISVAFAIVAVSFTLGGYIGQLKESIVAPMDPGFSKGFLDFLFGFFGNKYMLLTTLTMLLATFARNFMSNIAGAQEIGTFLIHIFFGVIGVPASLPKILQNAPWLLVFCTIIILINMLVSFVFGRLFRFSLEEIIITSNANIGGPTTAAALAIAKGWNQLVIPAMLVGILGYVIGNYYGNIIGTILKSF